jgi:hypothetical protein
MEWLRTQFAASVIVTEYTPAAKPVMDCVVAPVLHKYEYGKRPPVALALAVPELLPKQVRFVPEMLVVNTAGSVMVKVALRVQKAPSVTVTV